MGRTPGRFLLFAAVPALLQLFVACGGGGGGGGAAAPGPGDPGQPPIAVTTAAAAITASGATLTGTVNPGGAATTAWFEWGTDPALTTYTAAGWQSIGSGVVFVPVSAAIAGLSERTTYHYRVCGSNGIGTSKGTIVSFTTEAYSQPGPDVGQYFDRAIQPPGPRNYADNASHPLRGLTTADAPLLFESEGSENCLRCHYASGPPRTSDECLKCHFENQGSGATPGALDPARHANGLLELAAVAGNSLPTSAFSIGSLAEYNAWCLQCHDAGAATTLGGRAPSGKTVVRADTFENGRHRVCAVGCIYCHQPHGSGNARLVRSNAANRGSASYGGVRGIPMRFNVFPNDNSGSYTGRFYASPNENIPYRARTDNVSPDVFADADDDSTFCNTACHDPSKPKDRVLVRDGTTGLYALGPGARKLYLIGGVRYSIDNISMAYEPHGHVNGEIISTDDMAVWYAGQAGLSGPSMFKYPGSGSANPATFDKSSSPIPMFPDYGDGARDFTNGYLNQGLLRYRLTCSTCHNPHGTLLANGYRAAGYPDLRLSKALPSELCIQCHR